MRGPLAPILTAVLALCLAPAIHAASPQTFAPTLATFAAKRAEITAIKIDVDAGLGGANPQWLLPTTLHPVLLDRLATLASTAPDPTTAKLWARVPNKSTAYRGIRVSISLGQGSSISPFTVKSGVVLNRRGQKIFPDPDRSLEYWLWGTARIKRDQLLGATLLPVFSFAQCKLLNNQIVETTPRQCLLPDGNILLETPERPTAASLKAQDFDSCLRHGTALIATFPRRCMAAGGRVFTEPPRVFEPPAEVPISTSPTAVSATVPGMLPVSPTSSPSPAISPTEVLSRTGLGRYSVPLSPSIVSPSAISPSTPAPSTASPTAPAPPALSPTAILSPSGPAANPTGPAFAPVSLGR